MELERTAEVEETPVRLDVFLTRQIEGLGRARARRWVEAGEVRVDGRRASKGHSLHVGQRVSVSAKALCELKPASADPRVSLCLLYEDEEVLVVDKPAGVPTQPLSGGELGTLAGGLLAAFPELSGVGYGPLEPGILHRLDVDTSGAVLVARTKPTFDKLRVDLKDGRVDKRYQLLCVGEVEAGQVFDGSIENHPGSPRKSRVSPDGSGKPASTEVLQVERLGDWSFVHVRADRAARHQIRVHFAEAGHPLAADRLYGGPALAGTARHFLHASQLGFAHPTTGAYVCVEAPLAADLSAVLARLRSA